MQVAILGPLRVSSGAVEVALGGARLRALLVRLALDVGRVVPAGALADAVWPAGAGTRHALHSLMTRLRGALPDAAAVRTETDGYRLDLPPDAVDAVRFEWLAHAGRGALRAGRAGEAGQHLREALRLWRGDPLADVADAPFAAAAVARLEELRLTAHEDRAEADLLTGADPAVLVADLQAVTAAHPARERAHALLLRALHADGRTAEALDHYARLRTDLADRLGADPSAELRAAHLAVLRPAPSRPRRGALPVPLTSFVGREAERALVADRLAGARLVTLTGPGGAGKTRLATTVAAELAPDLPGGVWLVELAGVGGPDGVAPAVLSAVGATGSGSPLDRLVDALGPAVALLVLDGAEHLLDPVAALVEALLGRSPGLRVLLTSREPCGVPGEALVPVPPLAVADPTAPVEELAGGPAVRLFAERAAAAVPGFRLTAANAATVAAVCRRLDGLPLAIELAAARTRTVPVERLADLLDDRFGALTATARTGVARHRTLAAVVAWSWDLLDADERALAEALAVFPGTVTPAAAARVAPSGTPTRALLDALADKSLLQPVVGPDVRYRMLGTIREYGVRRLGARAAAARAAHARYFLDLAEAAAPELRGAGQLRRLPALVAERDNLLAALRHAVATADTDLAVRLASALSFPLTLHGDHAGAARLLGTALALPGGTAGVRRSPAVSGYLFNCLLAGSTPDDLDRMRLAVEVAHPSAYAIGPLLAVLAGDPAGAALPAEPPQDTTAWGVAVFWLLRALLQDHGGDLRGTAEDLRTASARFAGIGERWGLTAALTRLGATLLRLGDPAGALDALRRARVPAAELGRDHRQRIWLATAHEYAGDRAAAHAELAAVLAERPAAHDTALARLRLGELHRRGGDPTGAEREYRHAARVAGLLDAPDRAFRAELHTAAALLALARPTAVGRDVRTDDARVEVRAALDAAPDGSALAAAGVAGAALRTALGDPAGAAATLGAAHRLRGSADPDNPDVADLTAELRNALGDRFPARYEPARLLGRAAATALLAREPDR